MVEAGDAAQTLYSSNGVAKAAMDHPLATGAAVGAGGGAAAYGAAAGLTYLSTAYLGGAGTACVAFCGKAGQVGLSEYNAVSIPRNTELLFGKLFGKVFNKI